MRSCCDLWARHWILSPPQTKTVAFCLHLIFLYSRDTSPRGNKKWAALFCCSCCSVRGTWIKIFESGTLFSCSWAHFRVANRKNQYLNPSHQFYCNTLTWAARETGVSLARLYQFTPSISTKVTRPLCLYCIYLIVQFDLNNYTKISICSSHQTWHFYFFFSLKIRLVLM